MVARKALATTLLAASLVAGGASGALAELGQAQARLTARIDQLTARMNEYRAPMPTGQR